MADIEYRFGTGDGDPNVHHGQANLDVDGDGATDAIAVDFDGDGRYDDAMWDSDGDGTADTALLDLDDDGVAESAYHDPTGAGTWNAKADDAAAAHDDTPPATPAGTEDGGEGTGGFENQSLADDLADWDSDDLLDTFAAEDDPHGFTDADTDGSGW
ncbi:hypothetical protein ACOBQX_15415 [Actinokineospora sp. G85]|uniref:hypothetical protein n=1 Tax=Actinokineospora sp. G85 TaxID=3406626 RepID=UPI003C794D3A